LPSEKSHPVAAAYAGILLFVLGLAIGGGALEVNWRKNERFSGWQRADGTVIDVIRSGHPLVGFSLPSGERVSFTALDAGRNDYTLADSVSVLYDPTEPSHAVIDPRGARWVRNAVAAVASLLLMALGGYVAWYGRRRDLQRR